MTRRQPTGVLVFSEDGRIWTQLCEPNSDGGRFTGYQGRWWLHGESPGLMGYGYEGGTVPHVEMQVRASSNPELVGKTLTQQYELSRDGNSLITSDVRILFGDRHEVERLEWRRLAM